jgi:hypothetical protein
MGEIHSHSIPLESRESVCRIRRRECKVAWSSAFLGPVLRDPKERLFGISPATARGLLGFSKRVIGALRTNLAALPVAGTAN